MDDIFSLDCSSLDADETLVFASQRLCQMLKTFTLQWSKQSSIPSILLHGLDHCQQLVDYACDQCAFHCHTVGESDRSSCAR